MHVNHVREKKCQPSHYFFLFFPVPNTSSSSSSFDKHTSSGCLKEEEDDDDDDDEEKDCGTSCFDFLFVSLTSVVVDPLFLELLGVGATNGRLINLSTKGNLPSNVTVPDCGSRRQR